MKSEFYLFDEWVEEFKPDLENPYEIHSDKILEFDPHRVWTLCSGDDCDYVLNGFHYVNRIHYYVSEKSWVDGAQIFVYDDLDEWDEDESRYD